jgi:FkbM family methyltransferase
MTDSTAAAAQLVRDHAAAVRERDAAIAERDAARADLDWVRAALARMIEARDTLQGLREAVVLGNDPAQTELARHATKQDIYYCFRLLLGRNPNPEEWPGHSSRAGEDLANVVSAFVTCREFAVRGLLDKTYLGELELLSLPGFQIYVSREDLGVGVPLLRTGAYEPEVTAVFRRHVKPDMAVLDIGANIGYFTMLSASIVGPSGIVVAVEPNSENVKLLEASRRTNGYAHVRIVLAAAGRQTGLLALNVSHTNGITGEILGSTGTILGSHLVPCFALDAVMPTDRPLGFIKIDAEGAELNALIGLAATIDRDRPIIVSEFSPGLLIGISGCTGPEYLGFLISKGYRIGVIGGDGSETDFGDKTDAVMAVYAQRGVDHIDIVAHPG